MSDYYVGKPKRHGTYTGAGASTGPIPAPSNTGPAQVTKGQGMSVQDLIVAGRRVYDTIQHGIIEVEEEHDNGCQTTYGYWHNTSDLRPILSAAEVRALPVGAGLVDTLTGEEGTVAGYGGCRIEFAEYDLSTGSMPDRDLENRFALKTLPTEEA